MEKPLHITSKIVPLNSPLIAQPDIYSVSGKRPVKSFVVSRDANGQVISRYGDDVHNYSPYENRPFRQNIIYYNKLPRKYIKDAKWLVFILTYMVDTGRCGVLSIGSVMNHYSLIIKQVAFSDMYNITLLELLNSDTFARIFASTLKENRGGIQLFSTQLKTLFFLGKEKTGICPLSKTTLQEVSSMLSGFPDNRQHPVIPPRLFSIIIESLWRIIDDFKALEACLITLTKKAAKNKNYARSQIMQKLNGLNKDEYQPTFEQACNLHNLTAFMQNIEISNIREFSSYLTAVQMACKYLIHVYSGMRHSEALSLKIKCIRTETTENGLIVRLVGVTSKLIGLRKTAAWVTSKEIVNVVNVAQSIAKVISNYCNIDNNDMPLFPSTAHLPFMNTKCVSKKETVKILNCQNSNPFLLNLMTNNDWNIQEKDLKFLEEIDPFRDWRSEPSFKLGNKWVLHNHQFRRSMSFYISQSGLVSLSSLKRQLQHITAEMSLYYARGSGLIDKSLDALFNGEYHFRQQLSVIKPEADSTAYLYQVLLSDEPLHGIFGEKLETYNRESYDKPHSNSDTESNKTVNLLNDRKKLQERFKKGEIAYATTPLGTCTSILPCNKKQLRLITACINCNNAILKQSKINHCIKSYEYHLGKLNHDSVEYQFEKTQLDELKEVQKKIETNKVNTDVSIE